MARIECYDIEVFHWEYRDEYGAEVVEITFRDGYLSRIYWKVENHYDYYSFKHELHVNRWSVDHHIMITIDTYHGHGVKTIDLELEHYENADKILDQFIELLTRKIKVME